MKSRVPTPKYVQKAKQLGDEEIERLLVRMRGRFSRRLGDEIFSAVEAIALQLEYEDDQLEEWRARTAEIRSNDKTGRKVEAWAANSNINPP